MKRMTTLAAFVLTAFVVAAAAPSYADVRADLETELATWEQALAADSGSYEANWNLARVLIDLGNRFEKKDDRKAHYGRAVECARAAVALAPDDTWGHHYLAASVGKLALTEGGKKKIELSKEVREEALKAVECDPDNDKSHHILGRWNREVTHLSPLLKAAAKVVYGGVPKGASDEKAVEHFREAIRIAPDHVNHHLELGITWYKMKEYDEALAEFELAQALPEHDPNDAEYKAEAAEYQRKCEKKIGRKKDRRRH